MTVVFVISIIWLTIWGLNKVISDDTTQCVDTKMKNNKLGSELKLAILRLVENNMKQSYEKKGYYSLPDDFMSLLDNYIHYQICCDKEIITLYEKLKSCSDFNKVTINDSINIAAMDWKDFENLVRDLFEKEFSIEGSEVKITQSSHDGGVDAVIFDPDPIRGGKIVIQAKRYTNIVDVSAVRDLFGTVHNEGANKGILVTTSNFGADSYNFAKDKPITLINGSQLLHLLEKHNVKARIDIKEAKRILNLQKEGTNG